LTTVLAGGVLSTLALLLFAEGLEHLQARELARRSAEEVRRLEQLPLAVIRDAQREEPSPDLELSGSFPFRPLEGERVNRFGRMVHRDLERNQGLARSLVQEPAKGTSAPFTYWLELRPQGAVRGSNTYWLRVRAPRTLGYLLRPLAALSVLMLGVLLSLHLHLRWRHVRPISQMIRSLPPHSRSWIQPIAEKGSAPIRTLGQRINQLVLQINEADRYRRELFEALVHDLRGPLTRQLLRLEHLGEMETVKGDAELRQQLEALAKDSRSLVTITDRLASLAGAPDPIPSREVLPLDELCHQVADTYPGDSVDVQVPHLWVQLRRELFIRCLNNLIDNGLVHGKAPVCVSAQCRPAQDRLVIDVDDHGEGMRHYNVLGRPHLQRADDRERRRHFGLGLAIVERFCLDHDGELVLMPSPLGGLRAELRLPLACVET
jgi:signal transduction histidine kinase